VGLGYLLGGSDLRIVPPLGEGLNAAQELRPAEEIGRGGEVRQDGRRDKQGGVRWFHGRVLLSRAAAVTQQR
jgi:hypothetical protein